MKRDIEIIVSELYATGKLKRIINVFNFVENPTENRELKKDLEQELVILLLEMKKGEKLIRLYARDEIESFIFGIVRNMVYDNKRRTWVKLYREYFQNKYASINSTDDYKRFTLQDYREGLLPR